jgi:hypothetical protein
MQVLMHSSCAILSRVGAPSQRSPREPDASCVLVVTPGELLTFISASPPLMQVRGDGDFWAGDESGVATAAVPGAFTGAESEAGAYTRPLFSPTSAVLVTPPRVPLSNSLGENHAPDVSHKMCSC